MLCCYAGFRGSLSVRGLALGFSVERLSLDLHKIDLYFLINERFVLIVVHSLFVVVLRRMCFIRVLFFKSEKLFLPANSRPLTAVESI